MSDECIRGEERLPIGPFDWFVRWRTSEHWLDFDAYEGISENDDGKPLFWVEPEKLSASTLEGDLGKCKPTYTGYVKWDGCMEISLGTVHFCGAEDAKRLAELLTALHRLALKIPRVDAQCAGYPK